MATATRGMSGHMERRPTGTCSLELRIFPDHRTQMRSHNGVVVLNDHITTPRTLLFLHLPVQWILHRTFYQRCLSQVATRSRLTFRALDPYLATLAQRMITRALRMNDYTVVELGHFEDSLDRVIDESDGVLDQSRLPNVDSVLVLDDVDLAPKCSGGGGASRYAIKKLIKKGGFVANKSDQELGTCCICLAELSSPDGARLLRMDCSHLYHQACILPWLEKRNTCPTCRREVGR